MKLVFMGTPGFAVPSLRALVQAGHRVELVVTQPDRVKGRGNRLAPPPVKEAAQELGIPVLQPETMDEPYVISSLREAAPDFIVVVAFGFILKKEVLEIPRFGCVNAHASLLPKYRGAAPVQWAIANGEEITGVTTMLMDEGMDTGPVLLQKEVPISPEDTGGSLQEKLAGVAAELLIPTLEGLAAGTLKPTPQDHEKASYAPMLKKEHGRIDWTMSAREIALRVRAFDPWPGTFTLFQRKTLKITRAAAEEGGPDSVRAGEPGEIIDAGREGIRVACGKGILRVLELQPPGKRRMSVKEWLAGHRLSPGEKWGE